MLKFIFIQSPVTISYTFQKGRHIRKMLLNIDTCTNQSSLVLANLTLGSNTSSQIVRCQPSKDLCPQHTAMRTAKGANSLGPTLLSAQGRCRWNYRGRTVRFCAAQYRLVVGSNCDHLRKSTFAKIGDSTEVFDRTVFSFPSRDAQFMTLHIIVINHIR